MIQLKEVRFIFSILCVFASHFLISQELPPIQNYSPNDYLAENQNWSISQSDDGNIYVANNRGLLEFNGADWTLYPSPNNSTLRSVKVVGDKIYTGCYREFGYWIRNKFGKLEYTSLSSLLGGLNSQDQHFWNIEHFEDGVLFQSLKNIYILNTLTQEFQIINSETQIPKVFVLDNGVYYQRLKYGIYKLTKGIPQLISSNQILKDNIVVNISRENNDLLLQTKETGFYFLRDKELIKWNVLADKELSVISVYCSQRLDDGSFVVGSISNGIYHISAEGKVVLHVNRRKGIYNNTVLSQFIDKDDNLWLGLDIGISVLNMNSPYRVYNDVNGVLGSVYASEMYNGNLYLGTNQGLFYKKYDSEDEFKFIEGTEGQVWCLKQFDGLLFCGHNNGTYVINENDADLIVDFMGTWDIKKVPGKNNLLLQGHYGGLSLIEKKKDNWVFKNLIDGYSFSSRYFVSVSDKEILVNSELSGIDRLLLNDDFTEVIVKEKLEDIPPGVKSGLANYNDLLLYASSDGLFEYSHDRKEFLKDSLLTNRLFGEDKYVSGRLIADSDNKLWGFTDKNIVYFFPGTFDRHLRPVRIPLTSTERRFISDFENITRLKERTYLFGSSGGYFVVDLDDISTGYQEFEIRINSIQNSALNRENTNVTLQDGLGFKYTENNFVFKYNVPQFERFNEINYQYKLEGYTDDWSSWSARTEVNFDNLPYGKYVFKVRAKVSGAISANEASYQFKIASPWYLTYTALVFYALGMFVLMFSLLKMSGRYYKKEREILLEKQEREIALKELEGSQQLMKIRNDSLRMDIESKNRELAISTMSLIKKNEFLSDIKTELDKSENNSNLKSVMKIIDKNLNSSDDWNLFKEAFNNADREFFKKIKEMHPSLTPNDLKLCAFLRLNLSSKEIAPLLNISTRSVEIKRYRLRKKMDLSHETNLVQHILAF